MKPFVRWVEEDGFMIAQNWDPARKDWVGAGRLSLSREQRDVLAYCLTPLPDHRAFPYSTVIYSTLKKTGKTTIAAAVGCWYGSQAPAPTEIYVLANDEEQARSRVYNDMVFHLKQQGWAPLKYRVELTEGTSVQVLAQEYRSAAGGRQGLTIWDELWGYYSEASRRLWAEMTPPPTVPYPLRFIVTYAGFEEESDLLWDLYSKTVINGEPVPELAQIVDRHGNPTCFRDKDHNIFTFWDTEPRMPWQTPEYYSQQMSTLRPSDFLRMHRNMWVTSTEVAFPIHLWDKAVERGAETQLTAPLEFLPQHVARSLPISVAVDIGVKHDQSAVVGVYNDPTRGRVGTAFHKVWDPVPGSIGLDLELTVEAYLLDVAKKYHIAAVRYDPTQFHRSMVTLLHKGLPMQEMSQHPSNMVAATECLSDVLRNGVLEAYPSEEIRNHLKFAIAKHKPRGIMLWKDKDSKYPNDAAVALSMAIYDAVSRGGVDTTLAIEVQSPYSDWTAVRNPDLYEPNLPEPFQEGKRWRTL